jgi:hypothetical protein
VGEALYRVSRDAARMWQIAPGFIGREIITQKAQVYRHKRMVTENREVASFYTLGAFKGTPEALREFRETFSIDGKPLQDEAAAREKLAAEMAGGNDESKRELLQTFDEKSLGGSATDFGQIILLFTKPNLDRYTFELAGNNRLGVDNAWIIDYKQQSGTQSLHVSDRGKKLNEKLQGEIWVRQGDNLPLRIVLNSTRSRDKKDIRDEAKVDYTVVSGALLPAALTYRRFVDSELVLESIYRYSDWRQITQ